MGFIQDVQNASRKINAIGWSRTFLLDALRERDEQLSDAFNVQGANRWLVLLNALLINNGWAAWKSGALVLLITVLWLAVAEYARFGRKSPTASQNLKQP